MRRTDSAKLMFLGAARNVTGSRYVLTAWGGRYLVDCGLYQEREYMARNWERFPVSARTLDAVILTHAHLDHCGWLPRLVKEGFRGRVYCTPATADIAEVVLLDSAKIQTEDAIFKKKRHKREGRKPPFPEAPLYTEKDTQAALRLFSPVRYGREQKIGKDVTAVFHDAGHILGSSMVRLTWGRNPDKRRILFSGDVGRRNTPLLCDPTLPVDAEYVVMESTYGDRMHDSQDHIPGELAAVINETRARGGNVVIPSFAVERTQELLYHLSGLLREDRIPHVLAFVDSPMATRVTDIMRRHSELMDEETLQLIREGNHPCDFPGLMTCRTVEQSKAINHVKGSIIVIAGSGMCTGGRIKHHLAANIGRKESTILFVGYQAFGTLGRAIQDGVTEVRIHGMMHQVRARVATIHGFSGHADQEELMAWLSGIRRPPQRVFVTHGEPEAAEHMVGLIRERMGWAAEAPAYRDEVALV